MCGRQENERVLMNPKHLSKTALWYTPTWLIEKCRAVLGDIDFDPASDQFGNTRVRAKEYWEHSALELDWPKVNTVFLNPPGGTIGKKSSAALFWAKLMDEWAKGTFNHAIFIGFSTEIMQTAQQECGLPPQSFAFCVPSKRFGFDYPDGTTSIHPSHTPMIVYVPGNPPEHDETYGFAVVFGEVGHVVWNRNY